MKEKSEKRYVDTLKCRCYARCGQSYEMECAVPCFPKREYRYIRGADFINRKNSKCLWLTERSRTILEAAADRFDGIVAELKHIFGDEQVGIGDERVYYRQRSADRYDCVIEGVSSGGVHTWTYYEDENLYRILQSKYSMSEKPPTEKSPFYLAAVRHNDVQMQLRIKVYDRVATEEECAKLKKITKLRVLPSSLPEKFDKSYIVDSSTVETNVLRRSGYTVLHRPYFAMNGSTHGKWTLNPHGRNGVDAAPEEAPCITFSEYMRIIAESTI